MTDYSKPYVVGIGGSNFDIHTKINHSISMRDSNPAHTSTSSGGVTRNIMDNLSRLGTACILLTVLGNDSFGDAVRTECEQAGIDMSKIYVSNEYPTSCYIDVLDETGDMAIATSDMRNIENMPVEYLYENAGLIRNASAIVCDTNLEAQHMEAIIEIAKDKKIFVDPVSTAKAKKLRPYLGSVYFIKPNLSELEIFSDTRCKTEEDIRRASQKLIQTGLKSAAISVGARGCYYADSEGHFIHKNPLKKLPMVNATGAGDAFMAGIVHSYMNNKSIEDTIEYALACGQISTVSPLTINPDISDDYVNEFISNAKR